jgi:hypothetical protein
MSSEIVREEVLALGHDGGEYSQGSGHRPGGWKVELSCSGPDPELANH